ncbi:diaminopimelate decarboxylase [Rubrivirga litoralis]|uniref:Diaminopimelate decarboxylase n=1 Tax=Rubrivirga litoralis TaxID=3075598 RepID=A0ABU3BNZ7_9BACT|nr:diaminopimelate decarboxylase [Rubrivirga sp. F394]MDT0630983.1 diaminopimelate decarboxylase [Rubrivirga sp. F394]
MDATPPPKPAAHADALREAAERFGTPTYVYAEATVHERCRALRDALDGLPTRLLYALKANPTPALLRVIADEGFGFDAVSLGEVALLRALGVDASRILFTTTSTTDAELDAAAEAGVLPNLDDAERVAAFGDRHPGAEVCVRFNPGVGAGHHRHVVTGGAASKFGVALGQAEAVAEAAARRGLRVVGVHQHVGSGVRSAAELWPAVDALLGVVGHFPDLRFVDGGGGMGVAYRPGEAGFEPAALRDHVARPALDRLARAGRGDVDVWFEPGRYLVAEAGVLLTRVHTLKDTGERVFAGTDSGFNHLLRPALYDAYHALVNLSNPGGPPRPYDVAGNVCESGDLFARGREVPEIRRGDLLAVLDAGAYGASMGSTYNLRPPPATVVLRPDGTLDLVRPRRTPEDVARDVLGGAG